MKKEEGESIRVVKMTREYEKIANFFPETEFRDDPKWLPRSKVKNALVRAGYITYRAIAEVSDEKLQTHKWIGKKSIPEINAVLTAKMILLVQVNRFEDAIENYPENKPDDADWGPTGY